MKIMKLTIAAVLLALSFASLAYAHSGGTDRYGCHWDHKLGSYHCH